MAFKSIIGAVCACLAVVSANTNAAIYSITFYELNGIATNLFTDYSVSGTATFEIKDSAIGPDSFVQFSSNDFLAFDAVMNTSIGGAQFTLGIDDFPPKGDGTGLNQHEQGILFDASGQPLRFDVPILTYGNGAQICNPDCFATGAINSQARLTLWDDDGFDEVFLNDGTITTYAVAMVNGDAFTPFNGEWSFIPFDSIASTGGNNSYYLIQAVPIPAAVWLFGSGLLGLVGVARRKART